MANYYFENGNFVIESYDTAKTFSSFLPGIAGLKGIPMWVFYVNRGQGIASFGIQDKAQPILEFSPANMSYQNVTRNGFRTFLKIDGEVVEAFDSRNQNKSIIRKMLINEAQVSFYEKNPKKGYEINVYYFGLPQENFAALVRKVEVVNISDKTLNIEILDGVTSILPYGVDNAGYKAVSNLLRSWMEVQHLDKKVAYYKLRASTGDSAEIKQITKGNFYLSFSEDSKLITPIVDCDLVFDYDTSLETPVHFMNESIKTIQASEQITANKVPCGFTGVTKTLEPKQKLRINTLIGHTKDFNGLIGDKDRLINNAYIDRKQIEAYQIIRDLTDDIKTQSANQLFDEYSRQCYLDNLLRGGYPYFIKNNNKDFVYYVYSRKHGDLERDYNWFSLAPEYYSQGNGNFRDANQNRRNDVLFNPQVGTHNIKMFMSLIQFDGYNPLSVNGSSFSLKDDANVNEIINDCFSSHQDQMKELLQNKFTPGKIVSYVEQHNVQLNLNEDDIMKEIFSNAEQNIEAVFGEGYWIDHWTYNMDLIDGYLKIFPDKLSELLFDDTSYRYFKSPVYVYPRDEKYVVNSEGKVRQYHSIHIEDEAKLNQVDWLKKDNGEGDLYTTNLFVKLFSLGLIKFSTLDPSGIGIEMESEKPGWNDAMNGLPGLFGSGVSETVELLRVVQFLETIHENSDIKIPIELHQLMDSVKGALEKFYNEEITQMEYWDLVSTYREGFRNQIRKGIDGCETTISLDEIQEFIQLMKKKIMSGLEKAKEIGNGIYPTYFVHEAIEYKISEEKNHAKLPKVKVTQFKARPLPYFTEAPARSLKVIKDQNANRELHKNVQKTDIYDKKLLMYKTSVSIESENYEIGRARAFTPGWLEREAIFLHMTYKYLLGLLKGECYDEFFEAMKTNVVPFLKPEVYGRSTLENSSFIASSVNPNKKLHGQGFQARLTGSTSEFLSMWTHMMYGKKPFIYENNRLKAQLKPILPGWLFKEDGELEFTFLGKTKVTYINPNRVNTYDNNCFIEKMILSIDDNVYTIHESYLDDEFARILRDGKINHIKVYFGIN